MNRVFAIALAVGCLVLGCFSQALTPATCKNINGTIAQIQLWNVTNTSVLNSTMALQIFNTSFAPTLTSQSGFVDFQGSAVNASTFILVDFFTSNSSSSQQGLLGASSFVSSNSTLAGQMTQIETFNGTVLFDYFNQSLCSSGMLTNVGAFVALRIRGLSSNATITPLQTVQAFNTSFAPQLSTFPGFREYIGILDSGNTTIYLDWFQTQAEAMNSTTAAGQFVDSNATLAGAITLIESEVALVQFDDLNTALATVGSSSQ